jgi:uncharacterized LabA/DUF88 family protein
MRSHSALYVDAGYLIAAAATRLTGSSFRRGVEVDYGRLLSELISLVEVRTGLPLLRVYWYDAARDGIANPVQEQIALLPKVKLRLGRVGVEGEQKGVDLRIGLDMVGHSRNGAVDTMYLLSGDDDLTEAVEEAQTQGVQVIILAVPSRTGGLQGVSRHLMRAADDLEALDGTLLDSSVTAVVPDSVPAVTPGPLEGTSHPTPADLARRVPSTIPPRMSSEVRSSLVHSSPPSLPVVLRDPAELSAAIVQVATKTYEAWAKSATAAQRDELLRGHPSIPRDLDRALLIDLSDVLDEYTLSDPTRVELRSKFWAAVGSI